MLSRCRFDLSRLRELLKQQLELEAIFVGRAAPVNCADEHGEDVKRVLAQKRPKHKPGETANSCANGKGDWSVLDHAIWPPQPNTPLLLSNEVP